MNQTFFTYLCLVTLACGLASCNKKKHVENDPTQVSGYVEHKWNIVITSYGCDFSEAQPREVKGSRAKDLLNLSNFSKSRPSIPMLPSYYDVNTDLLVCSGKNAETVSIWRNGHYEFSNGVKGELSPELQKRFEAATDLVKAPDQLDENINPPNINYPTCEIDQDLRRNQAVFLIGVNTHRKTIYISEGTSRERCFLGGQRAMLGLLKVFDEITPLGKKAKL